MRYLADWSPRPRPERITHHGQRIRLEPLDAAHADRLFETCSAPGEAARFDWLFEYPPTDRADIADWVDKASGTADPLFFAVVDQASDAVLGRQALMRIDPTNGVIEIGSIYWGGAMARTPMASEALYLMAGHVFDDLGYRRFEWKCNDANEPSKSAALRFGFQAEGVFRNHMVQKGKNRDTAWFAMLDEDWPALRSRYEAWRDPANFDSNGRQLRRLQDC
ncbi:GNAT family N-acetyltransferase [Flavimaricola marinus]|uniref:Ribosomal-protein-L7/L12-serine acetyltransferase n=1 Tax=Flavimaricola marinus TaxID=1819565 RepID=A0A238LGK1_9RHOB|nr:GNAT family protein [Flavimaricola marinus]SMY08738.1 ribosomal-protein-L7/L12-serine acetyltransferase [Flavimaricola marinus]